MNQHWSSTDAMSPGNLYGLSLRGGATSWGQRITLSAAGTLKRPYQVTFQSSAASTSAGENGTIDHDSMVEDDPLVKRQRVEAVLLVSKTPVTTRKLAQLAHLADGTEARTLVRDLNQIYDKLGRALRIELVAGGYRMLTRPALAPWLARLGHLPPMVRLSSPMMETLAVVAYRQTVSRADIEAVRGVACGELLRQLMERDLIRIAGRSEELGRPYLYGTTKRFLQLFGLPNVNALPPIHWQALQEDSSRDEANADPSTNDQSPDSISLDAKSSSTDSTTSPKEPVVSTVVAPVLSEANSALSETDLELQPIVITDPDAINQVGAPASDRVDDPHAVIEDEEDDLYGDNDDDEDIDDMDEDDDDWAEDDDLDDDDDDEEEDLDDDDDWEEVDDEELDEEDEDDLDDDEWDDDDEEDEDWDDEDDEEEEEEEWG